MALPFEQQSCLFVPRRNRLCKDDRVEVRSEEEGLKGSWHSGTVIETELLDSQIKYVIKYDHLLVDDKSDYYVENLLVYENEVCKIRGHIRPFPPPLKTRKWDLYYGLCVDVYYRDCWWEGVVFDHEDGSPVRSVFFPDLGDHMKTKIAKIRITQDWNDVIGTWKKRGIWLFLELLEEFENRHPFDLLPKQFWSDLRQKEKFQKLGDWTSDDKKLWKILVSETLADKCKLIIGISSDGSGLGDLPGLVDSNNLVEINVQQCQSDVSIRQQAVYLSPQDLSVIPQKQDDKSDAYSAAKEEIFSSSGGNNINGKFKSSNGRKNSWLPAGPDMVPGAEFCPDAVLKYLQRNKKHEASVLLDIRKHLLYLCWKIEYLKEERFIRLRYTSPDGKVYYSLRQVCLSFNELRTENISSITQDENDDNGILFSSPAHSPSPPSKELPENQVTAISCHSDLVFVEPEYCPEAAADWYTYDKTQSSSNKRGKSQKMKMTLRARMHLSAVGWKFKWVILRWGKREMRYISPEGKVYSSLRLACRDAVRSRASACTHQEGKVVSKVDIKASCQKIPSSLRILKFKYPSALQKSKVGGIKKIHRKRQLSLLISSLHKQGDISDAQYSFSNLSKIRKTRGLIKLQNSIIGTRKKSVLRTSKRVKEVAVPTVSHQKPLTVLSWLIDNNIVLPRAKVHFCSRSRTPSTVGGRITRDGIKCNCCCKVFTLSGFTFHVSGKYHSPAASIFLEDGRSLLACQKEILQKEVGDFFEEPPGNLKGILKGENDNICSVCHYGGELVLCDQCPASFHRSCLGLVDVPDGDWFCPSCCCKICGHNKLKKDPECSTKDGAVLNCTQCEQKYHIWCISNQRKTCLKRIPRGNWFCSKRCKEIFSGLSELLGKPTPVGSNNLTWTLLKPNHLEGHKRHTFSDEAWIENCSKLSIAVDIMHECFETVEEPYTKRDLLKDVIFNKKSELNRLNFGGFYTVILQKDDEFVSVATIRVYGEKVAELPLVGTRFQYRRLGMCRILINALEKKLMELGVERLILPAVPSVLNTWTGSFGFSKLMISERLKFVDYTFLDFQDTVMCHKQLMKIPSGELCTSREILPRLSDDSNCDNMDLEGCSAISDLFQADQIQAGTFEQGQADVAAMNSDSHAEEPVDPIIMLNSESETCAGEISMDCSVNESTRKKQPSGLKVYTRRSEKYEISGELKYYKRRRLDCK